MILQSFAFFYVRPEYAIPVINDIWFLVLARLRLTIYDNT